MMSYERFLKDKQEKEKQSEQITSLVKVIEQKQKQINYYKIVVATCAFCFLSLLYISLASGLLGVFFNAK